MHTASPTKLLAPLLAISLLSGCASISKEECMVADWYAMGLTDGSRGKALSEFRDYQADCARHQLSSDFGQYQAGHKKGVVQYCVYPNGVTLGRSGNSFNPLCEDAGFADFQQGYFLGQQLNQAEDRLANLKRDQQQVEDKQQSLEKELADNKDRIVDDTSSKAEREELLRDNDRLRRELRRLAAELRSLQYQAQSTQDEIDSRLAELQL
ncbi:DUF2799 domain-containing protein [Bowmanella denitrificans]|uniref:DUF2799 domain-containing protein n=1 Tax=Bowmanella denitrificans TaxID=366582 RepID=UPI000C9B0983|nr:DUF2799 domain-containing protein [Bowmanella denitrificans]